MKFLFIFIPRPLPVFDTILLFFVMTSQHSDVIFYLIVIGIVEHSDSVHHRGEVFKLLLMLLQPPQLTIVYLSLGLLPILPRLLSARIHAL